MVVSNNMSFVKSVFDKRYFWSPNYNLAKVNTRDDARLSSDIM